MKKIINCLLFTFLKSRGYAYITNNGNEVSELVKGNKIIKLLEIIYI